MIDLAHQGRLDLLFSVGGSFHEVLPDPAYVRAALERIPLRVHMDIVLSEQMLFEPADTVLLLPATTRYETAGGVTETSTERRVIFSPEIPGPRVPEARDEWQVLLDLARRVRPELADRLRFDGTADIRREIAEVIPYYDGIQRLEAAGDQFQYGGPMLCEGWRFATADGKAHFKVVPLPRQERPAGTFVVSTRRGKQFNSMVQEARDPLTGSGRDAVLMSPTDARGLGLRDGDGVALLSDQGQFRGRVHLAPVAPGSLQLHWPEAQVLIAADSAHRGRQSGIPDSNAVVRVEPLAAQRAPGDRPTREAAPPAGRERIPPVPASRVPPGRPTGLDTPPAHPPRG
jgi:anaerobic selenocysteine-containing dehydrogenase